MKSSQPARIGKAGVFIAAALLFSCQTQTNSNAPSEPSASAESASAKQAASEKESASEADKPQVFEMRVPAYEQIPAVRIKLGLRGLSKTTFDDVRTPLTNYVYVPVRQCIGEHGPESARGRSYVARMEVQNGRAARFLEYPSAAEKAGELLDEPVRQCVREALESRKAELATDETLQLDVHVFIHES